MARHRHTLQGHAQDGLARLRGVEVMRGQRPHRRRRRHRRAEEVALVAVTNRREIDRPLDEALGPHERRRAQRGRSPRRGRDARADAARHQPVRARVRPVRIAARAPELDRLVRGEDVVAVAGDDDGLLDTVGVELQPSRIDGGIQTRGDQGGLPDADPARAAHRDLHGARAGQRELLVIGRRAERRPARHARADHRRHERDETERARSGTARRTDDEHPSRHRQMAAATQPPAATPQSVDFRTRATGRRRRGCRRR